MRAQCVCSRAENSAIEKRTTTTVSCHCNLLSGFYVFLFLFNLFFFFLFFVSPFCSVVDKIYCKLEQVLAELHFVWAGTEYKIYFLLIHVVRALGCLYHWPVYPLNSVFLGWDDVEALWEGNMHFTLSLRSSCPSKPLEWASLIMAQSCPYDDGLRLKARLGSAKNGKRVKIFGRLHHSFHF